MSIYRGELSNLYGLDKFPLALYSGLQYNAEQGDDIMKRIVAVTIHYLDGSKDMLEMKLTGAYRGRKDPGKHREYMKAFMRRKRANIAANAVLPNTV